MRRNTQDTRAVQANKTRKKYYLYTSAHGNNGNKDEAKRKQYSVEDDNVRG